MDIGFQCNKCGKLVNVDAEPGAKVRCHHCRSKVVVPAALASLPQPRMAGHAPAEMSGGDEHLEERQGEPVLTAMAHSIPWLVSTFFHVALAMIFCLAVMIAQADEIELSVPMPDPTFSEVRGGSISVGQSDRVTNARQLRERRPNASGDSDRELEIPNDGEQGERADLIGLAGGAGGGRLAPFGPPDRGGPGVTVEYIGIRGNAHHIVYLIDRSGSMFDTFDAVKHEIADSVGQLKPPQDFHVILFSDGAPLEKHPICLTPANEKYKLMLADFLSKVRAERTTNPVKAIARAFDVLARANRRPGKIIYMLTDGAFPDNQAVLDVIRRRNIKKGVLINTFLYGLRPPVAEAVMKKIARENGGRYRYVSPDE